MIGELNHQQIEDLLTQQPVGRIGCCHRDLVYIVPTSFAYDGTYIYVRSFEGMKLDIMRQNANVCFEVDNVADMADWQSVVVFGKFEELEDEKQREQALKVLLERHLPLSSSLTTHLGSTWPFSDSDVKDIEGIVFRIVIEEKTGRFERSSIADPTYE